ncbi:putative 2'-5' RNA ligase [Actinacidiphila reveromycinica]|uniref:RNA 2',3'-cyclic phosphodiesterase n=1 Tax=Actinacidiphila reveromycinica TaxID=659352 RepID=A0A7U3USJ0_9ACTN|nr:RNA 2',3'-cyclic phosphodiesterase [Streptomyces sp. SN-593]BBA97946.1 putative 2'-5' RNA ligase [Streptomyces sp. SN-593]
MRLFAAVLPPAAAVTEVAAAVAPLRRLPGADDLRWTATDGWHLTLAFLGEVPDGVRPELHERLARAARRHAPLTLRLAGGGHFGGGTLWTGVEGDLAALTRLAGSVRAAGRRAGAAHDGTEHAFRAHLTLARAARSSQVPLAPFADALAAFRGSQWTAGTLSLVASTLPRSGVPGERPRYDTVAAWPLGRTAGPGGGPPAADG